MMTALLASWLVTQTWSWEANSDAVKYRVYWGASKTAWCANNMVEFTSAAACDAVECQGDIPKPDFDPAFITVTSVDAAGNESDPEHGDIVACKRWFTFPLWDYDPQ